MSLTSSSPAAPAYASRVSVAAFTQGLHVPSARFRVRQLIAPLAELGVDVTEFGARRQAFPPERAVERPGWLISEAAARLPQLWRARTHDVTILQREMISTLPTFERFAKGPRVFDVDDAIWLYRRGLAANSIAAGADCVVCGNDFIAEYFTDRAKRIVIIPTTVDVSRFTPAIKHADGPRIIGWSGTSGGYRFFDGLEEPLAQLLIDHPDWRLRIVADQPPPFSRIPANQLEFIRWTADNEAHSIAAMDIGLMPLDDTLWSRGKCSYKMLLYMASGIPVVVSDVGMNATILRQGEVGIGVQSPDQWIAALRHLVQHPDLRARLGQQGRALVLERYSLASGARAWDHVIRTSQY